jgi:hypothetical protein
MMKITSAAIKFEDGTFSRGRSHSNAKDNARLHDRSDRDDEISMMILDNKYVEGFFTDDGTFVDRMRAFGIAKAAGQLAEGYEKHLSLSSYMFK